ncbi:MAG TPA: ABC transporter permease subunit [Solirubrobacteraceae bacterium]|nr:ABC transporter permease subunit [Solirubrobacteraceae bacterium]
MTAYIIRRLLWGIVLLILVSALTFVFFTVFPAADPAVLRAGRNASPATVNYIRHELGLDKPVYVHTVLGIDIGTLLGGAIITETVFDIPGIGRLNYDAIIHSDLPIVQGTVLLAALFVVVANILVDISYALLDPRVRYD